MNQSTPKRRSTPAAAVIGVCGLVLALGQGAAHAQNALGDGRLLDRNLQPGTAGVNTRVRDVDAQIRFANSIVTGNAPGGASFRGNVGYIAPGEFSARLGSNDLFVFQREAAPPSYGAQAGVRGTEALRYQFGLTTGSRVPQGMGAPLVFERAGSGANVAEVTSSGLRSTSDFLTRKALTPVVIGGWRTPDGRDVAVTASPLLGVRQGDFLRMDTSVPSLTDLSALPGIPGQDLPGQATPGQTTPGQTTPGENQLPGTGTGTGTDLDPLNQRGTGPATRTADPLRQPSAWAYTGMEPVPRGVRRPGHGAMPVNLAVPPTQVIQPSQAYRDVVDRFRQELDAGRAVVDPTRDPNALPENATDLERRLHELRLRLAGEPVEASPLPGTTEPDETAPPRRQPGEFDDPTAPPQDPAAREERRREAMRQAGIFDPTRPGLDQETVDALRRSRITVRDLQTPSVSDNLVYAENMAAGQSLLAQGRYFDAEERFVRAAAAIPGEAMASVGRIHSQIGAGLFMSASMNLRTLLTSNPELVPVRFATNLLPAPDRWGTIREQLQSRMADADPGAARASALLLSYLGYQFNDRDATQSGLETLRSSPEMQVPSESALITLLSSIWLDTPLPTQTDTE